MKYAWSASRLKLFPSSCPYSKLLFWNSGDDLFLLVENLRYYLESEEIRTAANGGIFLPEGNESKQTPLLLGRRFAYQGDMNEIFDSGGSGYTMNKAALKLLVTEGFPNYFPHRVTFSEDTMVAKLLKKFKIFEINLWPIYLLWLQ